MSVHPRFDEGGGFICGFVERPLRALHQVQRRQHGHLFSLGLDAEEVTLAELAENICEQQLPWMIGDGVGDEPAVEAVATSPR